MTAVIRYRTPYLTNNRDSFLNYFDFGNDFSLRRVIRLPTLLSLGDLIDLGEGIFVCSELNRTFTLTLDMPGKKLPDGVVFDSSNSTIPQGLATNIHSGPSLLHYTSVEGHAIFSFSTNYSNHIIVYDKFVHGNISRDLEYIPH